MLVQKCRYHVAWIKIRMVTIQEKKSVNVKFIIFSFTFGLIRPLVFCWYSTIYTLAVCRQSSYVLLSQLSYRSMSGKHHQNEYSICRRKGNFRKRNSEKLHWIDLYLRNKEWLEATWTYAGKGILFKKNVLRTFIIST